MYKKTYDINFFDKNHGKYDVESIKRVFEDIGGICEKDNFDCSNIKDKIHIQKFYNLPNEFRMEIFKHVFKNKSDYCSWHIYMMEEIKNVPIYIRSNYQFPKIYNLEYTNSDKSTDYVINKIISALKKEINICDKEIKKESKDVIKNNNLKQLEKANNNNIEVKVKKIKKKSIPIALKRKIWAKWIGEDVGKTKCICCKLTDITQLNFSCGHVISEFNGGELKVDNLKPICSSCNSSMGTTNMDEYMNKYGF